jgi:sortase A
LKYISTILILLGLVLVIAGGYEYFDMKYQVHHTLADTKQKLEQSSPKNVQHTQDHTNPHSKGVPANFQPEFNQSFGILKIPKLKTELPIIEGTDPDELAKGVGHYDTTAFPGQNKPVLLAGHRDTVFRGFSKLKKGDLFIVKLPYGTYQYRMKNYKIVDKDNQSVVQHALKGTEEQLLVSTCYPFRYVGNAPKRYVIYSYLVTSTHH